MTTLPLESSGIFDSSLLNCIGSSETALEYNTTASNIAIQRIPRQRSVTSRLVAVELVRLRLFNQLVVMSPVDLFTEDNLQYTFYPVTSGFINFKVRAANDAHVALTTGPGESDPMVEIFIGGWSNKKSVIRYNRQKPDQVEVETPDILNADEFRGFWVRWNGGSVSAGREGEGDAFISWDNPNAFPIEHVGVSTGWGATGTWIIEGRDEITTDDSLTYTFHPVISGELEFEFKGSSNCHIALTNGGAEADPMYEVIIGGWNNQKSVIRHCRQKPDKVTSDTPNIVDSGEYRKFLIQWRAGRVIVRSGLGAGPVVMEWTDENPFPVTHFGVRTAWGSTGNWHLQTRGAQIARSVAPSNASAPQREFDSSCWVAGQGTQIPPGAIVGGQDGEELYIGRASHEGALIPGKIVGSHGVCYIAWGGQEHGKADYEVLCGCSTRWVPTSGAAIPENALPGGESEDGEPLFIGRVPHNDTMTIGKVQPSHGCCYISYGGEELGFGDYEVLVPQ
ncbi:uncharacterized protein LOC143920947 isoform X1 [Arctopsyche grandis]|uniref:uncharacterized protein LOC143920947 isoform X1 n=1 Tax=Arctopsyche grandis TaxID=121162 RepID=UPI00406D724F